MNGTNSKLKTRQSTLKGYLCGIMAVAVLLALVGLTVFVDRKRGK